MASVTLNVNDVKINTKGRRIGNEDVDIYKIMKNKIIDLVIESFKTKGLIVSREKIENAIIKNIENRIINNKQ